MTFETSTHLPAEILEQRAAEQRRKLHDSVSALKSSLTELKSSVQENVRRRLDPHRFARRHVWTLAAGASFVALLAGHGIAGFFARR